MASESNLEMYYVLQYSTVLQSIIMIIDWVIYKSYLHNIYLALMYFLYHITYIYLTSVSIYDTK